MKDKIYENLKSVVDPEMGFDLVSLGLIYGVEVTDKKAVITMTLSTKSCPLHDFLISWVKKAALQTDGIDECEINLVWEPVWSIDMANDEVKEALK
ncbi:MAG: metal-sulfur cluster assembly factor, partial [Campylobacter sp.]|nr:metal-sulfur cluster assembly factor [Campylobacter sp.]